MRLRQIEIFYHVYRAGSISGAARDLFVSQPSVSKVLLHLEDQLGFPLFFREKGRLVATDEAHELFADVARIYDLIGMLKNSAQHIANRKGGHLNLGVLPSLGLEFAPKVIANLRAAEPNLSFGLMTMHSDQLRSALIEKRCDICMGFRMEQDNRIESQEIVQIDLVLVGAPGLAESGEGPVNLEHLEGKPFVSIKESDPAGVLLNEALAQARVSPKIVATANTYHVAMSLVAMKQGLAVVDRLTARAGRFNGLTCLTFSPPIRLEVSAYYLKENRKADLINRFLAEAVTVGNSLEALDHD